MRQYGHEQWIPPNTDRSRPHEPLLRSEIVQRFEPYWVERPQWIVDYGSRIPPLSKAYKTWLNDPRFSQPEKESRGEAPMPEEEGPRPNTGIVIREPALFKKKPGLIKGKGKEKVIPKPKKDKRKMIKKGENSGSNIEVQVKWGVLTIRTQPAEVEEERSAGMEEERPAKRPPKERFN